MECAQLEFMLHLHSCCLMEFILLLISVIAIASFVFHTVNDGVNEKFLPEK